MNLEDLLSQWSEHEPERCRYDEQDGEWMVMTAICWSCLPDPELAPSDIQGAVQQAIEARNAEDKWWDFSLTTLWGREEGRFKAIVATGFSDRRHFPCLSHCPAHALLAAYLQAIKQTAEVAG